MKNICIIGLAKSFTKNVAYELSKQLDMFYADVNEILNYQLLDADQTAKKNSRNYILKLQSGMVKRVASYENTVFTLDYDALVHNENYNYLKENSLIIYLHAGKITFDKLLQEEKLTPARKKIEQTVFDARHEMCKKLANVRVMVKSTNVQVCTSNILKQINTL